MSLLFRRRPEPESTEGRSLTLPSAFVQGFGTFANVGDPASGETSLQSVAVRSTADLIASLTSELPAIVYRNGKQIKGGIPDNIEDPGGDGTGREDWLYRLVMSWLLRGNAYGEQTSWDSQARARTVDLWHPDDVTVTLQNGRPVWYMRGKRLAGSDLERFQHWRVNPVAGRVQGLSPVSAHAATIGVSLSSTQFGRQWFTDGAHPSGMLTNDQVDLNEQQIKATKAKFVSTVHGSQEPLVMGKGWKFDTIQVNPEESQFLQTINATEAQCARMFGPGFAEVMGYESGGSMTYANVVDRRQDLLVFSMGKWLRRADRVLTQLLPPSTLEVRLNRDALLETTTLQRYQAHELALRNQWRTVNEVRQIEDLEPVAWGNQPAANNTQQGVTDGQPA